MLAVLVVGALVAVIILNRHILLKSFHTIANLDWVWVLPALVFELLSLTAFGVSRVILLRAKRDRVTLGEVMAITYAGNALSMAVPFAGAQLAAVFSYRQLRRHGLGPAITSWALAVSAIVSSTALAIILVVGALVGGAAAATAFGFIAAALFALPGLIAIMGLRSPTARAWLLRLVGRMMRPVRRYVKAAWTDPDALGSFLDRLASISLQWQGYAKVFILAMLNWLFDCACLACSIKATGQPIPWQALLLVYGAGAAVGSSGITPGGFALVEVAIAASLTATGMTASAALAAAITYRLMSFWLLLIGGGISLIVLTRQGDKTLADQAAAAEREDMTSGQGARKTG